MSGSYIPVSNIINLVMSGSDLECMSSEKKLEQNSVLVHEVRHMKVTRYVLDEENDKLLVKIGFYDSEIELRPLVL